VRIVAFDPGGTTGYCVLREEMGELHAYGEAIPLKDFSFQFVRNIISVVKPHAVGIESVVMTGRLSKDKVQQLWAYDRIIQAAELIRTRIITIPPEARKHVTDEIPEEIRRKGSDHVVDAYLQAVYTLQVLKELQVANTSG